MNPAPAMLEPWTISASCDPSDMEPLVKRMRAVLQALEALPPMLEAEQREWVLAYCESLVTGQRGRIGRIAAGSWSVAVEDEQLQFMGSDGRVDFVMVPTYIATAILSRVLLDHPWIAIRIPAYHRSLRQGLRFCLHRHLHGAGNDAWRGMTDALTILATGKVPLLLSKDPELCPELARMIQRTEQDLRQALLEGPVLGPWGNDLTPCYQAAQAALDRCGHGLERLRHVSSPSSPH